MRLGVRLQVLRARLGFAAQVVEPLLRRVALPAHFLQRRALRLAGGELLRDVRRVRRGIGAGGGCLLERPVGDVRRGLCAGGLALRLLMRVAQRVELRAHRFKLGLRGHGFRRYGGLRVVHRAADRARRAVLQVRGQPCGGAPAACGLRGGDGLVLRGHRQPAFERALVLFRERLQALRMRLPRVAQLLQAVERFLERAFFLELLGQRFGGVHAFRKVGFTLLDARALVRLRLLLGLHVAHKLLQRSFRRPDLVGEPLLFPASLALLPQRFRPALQTGGFVPQRFERRACGLGVRCGLLGLSKRCGGFGALLFRGAQLGLQPRVFVCAVERGLRLFALGLRRRERGGERFPLRRARFELRVERLRVFHLVFFEQRLHPGGAVLPLRIDVIQPLLESRGQRVPDLAAEERLEDFSLARRVRAQQAQELALRQDDDLRELLGGQRKQRLRVFGDALCRAARLELPRAVLQREALVLVVQLVGLRAALFLHEERAAEAVGFAAERKGEHDLGALRVVGAQAAHVGKAAPPAGRLAEKRDRHRVEQRRLAAARQAGDQKQTGLVQFFKVERGPVQIGAERLELQCQRPHGYASFASSSRMISRNSSVSPACGSSPQMSRRKPSKTAVRSRLCAAAEGAAAPAFRNHALRTLKRFG